MPSVFFPMTAPFYKPSVGRNLHVESSVVRRRTTAVTQQTDHITTTRSSDPWHLSGVKRSFLFFSFFNSDIKSSHKWKSLHFCRSFLLKINVEGVSFPLDCLFYSRPSGLFQHLQKSCLVLSFRCFDRYRFFTPFQGCVELFRMCYSLQEIATCSGLSQHFSTS